MYLYILGLDCVKRHNGSWSCSDVEIIFQWNNHNMTRMKMTRMAKLGFWSASCGTFIPSTAVTHICPTLSTLGKHFMQDCKYKNTNTNTNIQIQLHPFNIGQTFWARQLKIKKNHGYHSHPSMIGYNCTKFIFWQKSMKHAPLLITPVPRQSILWRFRQNGLPMKLLLLLTPW